MESQRVVNFYFYNVFEVDERLSNKPADLTELFNELYNLYNPAKDSSNDIDKTRLDNEQGENVEENLLDYLKIIPYNDEKVKLIYVYKNENDYFHLTFERLHHVIPNVSKVLGSTKPLDLEDDEYIGHQITVLYDPFKKVFMIQRNISSLSPNGVEIFIDTLYREKYDNGREIKLSLIEDERRKQEVFNAEEYRDFFVRITRESSKDLFKRIFPSNRDINVEYVEFRVKAEKVNDVYFENDAAKEIIETYKKNKDVEKLMVKARINENENISVVDVYNQKLQRQIIFTKNDRSELNTDEVFSRMQEIYRDDVVHHIPD
ncbi:DUF6731 family protein [Macrococcus brunensis]|uniref:DUF6731 family protein n=1 Tax=Macrococcus brunensis TaxID=198483 RepID=UPI001EF0E040|nr:DUF6731 family protein [Macrococcus brunensis]ULG74174.1 hypothetical protein MGG13_11190 [Macrococcus brunensis]